MKEIIVSTLLLLAITLSIPSCKMNTSIKKHQPIEESMGENNNPISVNKLKIKVGEKTFVATILVNSTAKAFQALLPLTLNMEELNDNEKFAQLPRTMPTNASVPASIQSGDLMMYGSSTFVLFYKSFSTTYSYTKIGEIDDVSGLAAALGSGNVTVIFETK
jgi:hypothetical protein